jgi:hypothetical protein
LAFIVIATALPAHAEDNQLLTRILHEGRDPQVRAGAAAVLGQRRDLKKRPELEVALADQHPVVRAAAANALGRIGARESLSPLNEVTHDHVKTVAVEARDAIHYIEAHAPTVAPERAPLDSSKARFGLVVGELRNQSSNVDPALVQALGVSIERNLHRFGDVVVYAPAHLDQVQAAVAQGLRVYRVDGAVTTMSAQVIDGQLTVHCEVVLLVIDSPTGMLRTLIKGAARGVELPQRETAQQKLAMARRVVDGAVRSALHNAEAMLAEFLQPSKH